MLYARNMPPKNMISVMRKIHIPSVEQSLCCSTVSNCTRSSSVSGWAWSANFDLLSIDGGVVVGLVRHDRRLFEVMYRRRRGGLPFQPGRAPGICARHLAVLERPGQIDERHQVAHRQDARAGRGENVEDLELVGVDVIAARHAHVAEDELREEGKVESEEHDQ